MTSRITALAFLLTLVAACSANSVDSWMDTQSKRLKAAGVTFPAEQARNTIVNMTSACVIKKSGGDDLQNEQICATTTQSLQDWVSPADALQMWRLADADFCNSIPNAPLGGS